MTGARLGGAIVLAGTLGAAAIAHAQAPAPAPAPATTPPLVQAATQTPTQVLTLATTPATVVPPVSACASASLVAVDAASTRRATRSILCLVNGARTAAKLPPVRASKRLALAARRHTADMCLRTYFSHDGPNGDDLLKRVTRAGYRLQTSAGTLGETLAFGSGPIDGTPAGLMQTLMNSPEHRAIILDRHFREVGIGLSPGAPIAGIALPAATLTLDFGRR